ncbi:MAG TPA: outer membrane protein assembly factor BamA [Thermoanaerobaculia bacterium]|nr:outer membrane protein assembly factor BamA [Thermoanaerobaculia bacterium]
MARRPTAAAPRAPFPGLLLALLLGLLVAVPPAPPVAAQEPSREPATDELSTAEPGADQPARTEEVLAPQIEEPGEGQEALPEPEGDVLPEVRPGANPELTAERAAAEGLLPPRVSALEIRSDTPLVDDDRERLRQLLTLEVGEPATSQAIARSLRNLHASGLAAEAAVYTRPSGPGEVVAVVVLYGNLVVEEVRIEGDTGALPRSRLRDELQQRRGDPLIESRVLRDIYALQDLFPTWGHFEARVSVAPEIDPELRRATIVYRVEAGPRATVDAVRFEGDTAPFAQGELLEPLRLRPGEAYRASQLEGDAERLRDWLVERKYRAVEVGEPRVEYREATATVIVTHPLEVGPQVLVEVEGADLSRLKKRGLLPFMGDDGYDEALVLLALDRIRDWYQAQGHYEVEVDYREERVDGVLEVTVIVEPGPRFELEEIDFVGNEQVSDSQLRELMVTAESNLLSRLPLVGGEAGLVDAELDADLDNIRGYYALQGFADARIGPAEVDRDGGDLRITIPIVEGERRRVVELGFEGVEAIPEDTLRDLLPLEAGGPFHPLLLEESELVIRARYEEQGFDAAQVSGRTEWNTERTLVDVIFDVLEGPRTVVDRIIVRGNDDTKSEVIRRTIGLDAGDAVSRGRLLEVERALYQLGIFSRVEVELTSAPLGETTRDVVIRVEEGEVRQLVYGATYDSELGFGGTAGFSHANLLGRAIRGRIDAQVLERQQQFRLFVDQPYFFDYAVPVTYSLFQLQYRRDAFEVESRGGRVEAVKQLGRTRFGLAYDYRNVTNTPRTDIRESDDPDDDLRRQDQEIRVSSIIPNVLIDRRDDPISPRTGWNTIAQVQYAFPVLSAEADWLKLFVQQTHYFDVGFGTLALSGRAGGIEPFSELPDDVQDPFLPSRDEIADLPSRKVFIAERFFAGGSNSHRAYEQDELGIPFATCRGADGGFVEPCSATLIRQRDEDGKFEIVPVGGNGLALLNLDYRFPIFGPVEGTVFFDTGNVWADWRDIDFDGFRHGTGLGIRYDSPIGPLRLEAGYPLNPVFESDDAWYEDLVFFISLGNPF